VPTTITNVAQDANALHQALMDLNINLTFPELTLSTDFEVPADPTLPTVTPLQLADLTTKVVDGAGVFDALMTAVNAHLTLQHEKGRITGGEYAKVYLGAFQSAMQVGLEFLRSRDRTVLENLQLLEGIKLAQAQTVRAHADVELARAQIQQARFGTAELQLKAYTAMNQYVSTKMDLVLGYNGILEAEHKQRLTEEQVDSERAKTKDTLFNGAPILGLAGMEKELAEAKMLTQREELDTTRANTKDTLLDGGPISGIVAVEKAIKEATQLHMEKQGLLVMAQYEMAHAQTHDLLPDGAAVGGVLHIDKLTKESQRKLASEQYELARAQIRETLSDGTLFAGLVAVEKLTKEAQRKLTEEQVDTQRAETKETLVDGVTAVAGIAKFKKDLTAAQSKLVLEQYESQRGQTRGTLSTGETVIGLVGAQTDLYRQQVTSYKRDAESKGVKMLLDTWTARKTIDEGVEVPVQIDTAALETAIANYRSNLSL
jgi:hypothetical protein